MLSARSWYGGIGVAEGAGEETADEGARVPPGHKFANVQ
jgi:hypothetical protein